MTGSFAMAEIICENCGQKVGYKKIEYGRGEKRVIINTDEHFCNIKEKIWTFRNCQG